MWICEIHPLRGLFHVLLQIQMLHIFSILFFQFLFLFYYPNFLYLKCISVTTIIVSHVK